MKKNVESLYEILGGTYRGETGVLFLKQNCPNKSIIKLASVEEIILKSIVYQ